MKSTLPWKSVNHTRIFLKTAMKKKSFRSSDVLSVCAIFISLITFCALLYQTWLIQKQQYASVLPILELFNSGPTNNEYKLVLVNSGVGPAFVKSIKVHYKDSVYEGDPQSFLEKVILPHDTINYVYSHIRPGKVIPAGEKILLFDVKDSEKDASKLRQYFGYEAAKLEFVYGSVYEEMWRMKGMIEPPVKE